MRFSHILKKQNIERPEHIPQNIVSIPEPKPEPLEKPQEITKTAGPITENNPSSPEEYVIKVKEQRGRSCGLYAGIINFLRRVFKGGETTEKIYFDAEELTNELIDELSRENEEILVLTSKIAHDNYLLSHLANVFILSVKLGIGLNFSKNKVVFLGVAALLHEFELDNTDSGKEFLSPENKQRIMNATLEKIQHGERFVNVLEEQELEQLGSIIALLDLYERLSHSSNPDEKKLPHEVLKMFIEERSDGYDNLLVKKMIEELSIYPPGSFVRLDTDEVGEIVRANKNFPTRPVVRVFLDRDKSYLSKPKYINLIETPVLHIKEAVDDEKLEINDKKFILKQKISKRWVQ